MVAVFDVLSFTTALTVAVDNGIEVFPFRWRDERAEAFAAEHDAVLAVGRSQRGTGRITLSAPTIRAARDVRRLVLPSPNGSTISHDVAELGATVIGVSLRNGPPPPTGPSAGSPTSQMRRSRPSRPENGGRTANCAPPSRTCGALAPTWPRSPNADSARSPRKPRDRCCLHRRRRRPRCPVARVRRGQELIGFGYPADVDIAAELDSSTVVPQLCGTSFTASSAAGDRVARPTPDHVRLTSCTSQPLPSGSVKDTNEL